MNRELDPVPTIYPVGQVPSSSLLPLSSPTDRTEPDQLPYYHREHKICDLDALNENLISGFTINNYDDYAIYFLVEFSSVDVNFHVKQFYKDSPIPLPEWFRQGQSNN